MAGWSDARSLIDLCYSAVQDDASWPRVLDGLTDLLGARGSAIVSHDPTRTAHLLRSDSSNDAGANDRAPRRTADPETFENDQAETRSSFSTVDQTPFSSKSIRSSSFPYASSDYQSVGLTHFTAKDSIGRVIVLEIYHEAGDSRIDRKHAGILDFVVPHIIRAYQLTVVLASERRIGACYRTGIEHNGVGTILLDGSGVVQSISGAVTEAASGSFTATVGSPIRFAPAAERDSLKQLIAKTIKTNNLQQESSVIIQNLEEKQRIIVDVVPLAVAEPFLQIIGAGSGGALLLIRRFATSPSEATVNHLRKMGLTTTEASIAAGIGRGSSPRQIATGSGVSEATVRVHLRSIFHKLVIGRQSELAVLVTRLDTISFR